MTKSIELLGTMILNKGEDLIAHYKSIDHPVKHYVIIDNSEGKNPDVREAIDYCTDHKSPFVDKIYVIRNRINVGFSGSVNQIIRQHTDKPYWFVMSVDWHPKPGELKRLAERLESPFTAIMCDSTQNGYSSVVITRELIQKVGMLDENFYPAYYEDNDHRYRMKLAQVEWELYPLGYTHKVSSTLKSSATYMLENQRTFQANFNYYVKKWGGCPGSEKFKTPFNSGAPLDYAPYDPLRIETQRWQ